MNVTRPDGGPAVDGPTTDHAAGLRDVLAQEALSLYEGNVLVREMVNAAYERGVAAGRTAAADAMRALANRMERRADNGDNPADCNAMAEFADELRALADGGERA